MNTSRPERHAAIVAGAEKEVTIQRALTHMERIASLKEEALSRQFDRKFEQFMGLTVNRMVQGVQTQTEWERQQVLHDEAESLGIRSQTMAEKSLKARHEMDQNKKESAAHVAENLPQYIEVATDLANAEIQQRTDYVAADLLDPATRNEEVTHLLAADQLALQR